MINGSVTKRKPRESLSKCLVRIRGIKFHTHPNGKSLQRLGNILISKKNFIFLALQLRILAVTEFFHPLSP